MACNYNAYNSLSASIYTPSTHNLERRTVDPATLTPGEVHLMQYKVPFPSQTFLDGIYARSQNTHAHARYLFLPRQRKFCGEPSFPSILFNAQGESGPTLKSIMQGTIIFDGAYDQVIAHLGWTRIKCVIDWPDITHAPECIHATDYNNNSPITRDLLAKELCAMIYRFFRKNPVITVDWRIVRLVALSYYRNIWVPVLAIDA